MSRLPIRLRLTAVFILVMTAVLLIIGLFLYYRTEHTLDDSIDAALRSRQGALRGYAASVRSDATASIPAGESFAQLLTVDGRVIDSHPATSKAVVSPAEARRAARGRTTVERHERFRFLAGPARFKGRPVVVVAGTSLAERERALEGLGGALLIGFPLALLLAAGIAYATAAAALAPVEDIRKRAETVIRADPDARLPVSETDDEIRRLALTLNDMLQRMARAAAHERSFVANASHELRTPLAALQAEIELALRRPGSAEDLRAALVRCQGDTRRLIALAEDLLVLARADDGPEVPRELTDLDDLLADVAEQVRYDAAAQGRSVSVRPSGLSLELDPVAVFRAIRNLTDNALVHGRGSVTLTSDLRDGGENVAIVVLDEGELADPDIGRQAFDRFFRGHDATGLPGAGLGLALVQAVASDHGGTANLEPDPDGGSRASLVLPAHSV